jgi:hypothetical protein
MSRCKSTWTTSVARTDAKNSSSMPTTPGCHQNLLSVGSSKLSEYAAAVVELGSHLGSYNRAFPCKPSDGPGLPNLPKVLYRYQALKPSSAG